MYTGDGSVGGTAEEGAKAKEKEEEKLGLD